MFKGLRKKGLVQEKTFRYKVKKIIPLFFALSVFAGPSHSWGWGDGSCSKDKSNQDAKTEEVEETDL